MASPSPPASTTNSLEWGSVPDWVAIAVAVLALLASAWAIWRTEVGRRKDKKERDELRELDRKERESQAARDIIASDFSDEIRGPILACLCTCSEIIGVLREISRSTEVHTTKISESIKLVSRERVPGLFSDILDVASRCRENSNFSELDFCRFLEEKQDATFSKFSQANIRCTNITSAVNYVQDLILFIQKLEGEIRGELARLHQGIKTGSIMTGRPRELTNSHTPLAPRT